MLFFDIGDEIIEKFQLDKGIKIIDEDIEMPKCLFFRQLWSFLEYPKSSKQANIFALVSMFVIILSLVLFVIVTLPEFSSTETTSRNGTEHHTPNKHDTWVFAADTCIIIFFTVEFVLRLVCCPNKLTFCTTPSNIIDFLSVLPYYIPFALEGTYHSAGQQGGFVSLLRVVRVVRVLKLARHSRGLQLIGRTLWSSINELMLISFVLFILILICGSTIYYSEQHVPDTPFTSIPHSAWWALVSIGTVGYGDMTPCTVVGKLIGGMTMLFAVLMMALPVPSVVSNFLHLSTMEANRRRAKNGNG